MVKVRQLFTVIFLCAMFFTVLNSIQSTDDISFKKTEMAKKSGGSSENADDENENDDDNLFSDENGTLRGLTAVHVRTFCAELNRYTLFYTPVSSPPPRA